MTACRLGVDGAIQENEFGQPGHAPKKLVQFTRTGRANIKPTGNRLETTQHRRIGMGISHALIKTVERPFLNWQLTKTNQHDSKGQAIDRLGPVCSEFQVPAETRLSLHTVARAADGGTKRFDIASNRLFAGTDPGSSDRPAGTRPTRVFSHMSLSYLRFVSRFDLVTGVDLF